MRRLLAAALSLCLASSAPAGQFKLTRIFTFNVPPVATGAPLQTPALQASVPAPVDAPITAVTAAPVATFSRVMATATPKDPDKQSSPQESPDACHFSNFFDGLLRREPRARAVNAASYLLTARDEHALPSTSRVLAGAAITALRRFRLDIGHALANPEFESSISADNRSSARKRARLARHIRGIEENHAPAQGASEEPDSRQTHVLGMVVQGKENINALLDDRASSAGVLTSLLDREPHRSRMAKRWENSLLGLLVLATAPASIQMISTLAPLLTELARAYLCALPTALWVFTEPYARLRHRLVRDGFQQRVEERTRRFLAGNSDVEWIYDSKAYALQGGLVDALLRHGKTQEGILSHLWEQDFNSSLGIFGRPLAKMIRSTPPGREPSNDVPDRWVIIDRLLRHDQAGEPELILVVRSSTSRPRFPKPARESSWAPDMQLAPISVRNDEFR